MIDEWSQFNKVKTMKIYSNTLDLAQPTVRKFWVAPNSTYKIGVKLVNGGTPVENEFIVKDGDTTLTPDAGTVDGFKTYTLNSGSTGEKEFVVVVSGISETLKIVGITTDSTVFEIDAAGMQSVSWDDIQDKPDVLTPSSSEITELDSTVSALSESFGELDSTVSALASSLSSYATISAMESYVDAQIGAVLSTNF